ncbi:hypothetical protein [Sinorhizobium mexicanum]|uniref:Uncharacterized protein n=1 Tax=Sinorhizobium mexicanum TaxID=375549 RepID=A0A859QPX1_9HYPH|nr:hypothetical protein [Sinorhizobium mexicanum]MBP1888324.1 hypothetical protein [Sinorhizobium mexicanum]QLL64137.1 hypothetical protein FKV68_22090 [Sinorhizobium mexicanum]
MHAFWKTSKFPDGAVLAKGMFEAATGEVTTGMANHTEGLVRHGERKQRPLSRATKYGVTAGFVLVRCGRSFEEDVD